MCFQRAWNRDDQGLPEPDFFLLYLLPFPTHTPILYLIDSQTWSRFTAVSLWLREHYRIHWTMASKFKMFAQLFCAQFDRYSPIAHCDLIFNPRQLLHHISR